MVKIYHPFRGSHLPANVREHLDLKQLIYEKDNFVPDDLAEYYSDLLLSVPLKGNGQEVKVYFLFEHKSYPDQDLPLQLLRYILEIWAQARKYDNTHKLPMVIPLVITHSKDKRKKVKISELVEIPDDCFKVYLPEFDYLLFDCITEDLNIYDVEVKLKSLFLLWKYARTPGFLDSVRQIFQMIRAIYPQIKPDDFLITLAHYLYHTRSKQEFETITEIVDEEFKGGINMETIADMLRNEGMQKGVILGEKEGIAKGELKNAQETLIDIATEQYGPLPGVIPIKIKSIQSIENLRALTRKVLRTDNLDNFTELVNRATDN